MDEVQEINTILKKAKWQVIPHTKKRRNLGIPLEYERAHHAIYTWLHIVFIPLQLGNVAYFNDYEDAMQLLGLVLSRGNTA